jgi:hypothetical protein
LRRIALFGSAPLIAVAVLGIHLVAAGGTPARSGRAATTQTRARPRGPVVRGRLLTGLADRAVTLDLSASAPLVGNFGPVAAPSRDGRFVAYNTWQWAKSIDWQRSLTEQGIRTGDPLGRPLVRVRDLHTGADTALDPGSYSIAWRADGAVAYARGAKPAYLANTPFLAEVVVRSSMSRPAVEWSQNPARYLVEGWAGRRLVVRRQVEGESGDLVVLEGPGTMRPLAEGVDLLAIDPHGDDVLVAESRAHSVDPAVRLISVTDGTEKARVALSAIVDPVTDTPVADVTGLGNWRKDRAVVASSTGLVVFHVAGGRLSVEQVLHVDSAAQVGGGFYEPRFTDDGGHTIVAWADVPASRGRESAQFVCDRYALTCDESTPVPSAQAPRPVYDASGGDQ